MSDSQQPSGELVPAGHETDRDASGRFRPGNVAAVKHGARRDLDGCDLAEAVEDERHAFVEHLGGEASLTPTLARLTRSTARVAVMEDSTFLALIRAGGPVTSRGNRRRLFDVWMQLEERLARRLDRLGLERREKRVQSLAEIAASYVQRGEP